MAPLGFHWRASVAALAGVPAKEIVVSTLGVLYTNDEAVEEQRLGARLSAPSPTTGRPDFNPAVALSFMVFILLYCPCIATLTAVVRETGLLEIWSFFGDLQHVGGLGGCICGISHSITNMNQIDICLKIAIEAHRGQLDRDGNPVILHPLTVGMMGITEGEKCVGFLHDTIEDAPITAEDLLSQGVRPEYVEALRLLTHDESVPYLDYVAAIKNSGNELALAVKLNDLRHNLRRGVEFGYPRLVEKHSEARRLLTPDPLPV